ncbi:MAG TPA: zinc ribbon domain-containing protein [Thermoanaerobaculia bacterium]
MSSGVCAACGRSIDAAAKLCPYCGADPATGERVVDTQAILQEVFHTRELSTTENVMEFARQRQGIVIAVSIAVAFLVLAGLHQFVTARNATVETNAPAVPLTEITDVANQKSEVAPVPLPDLDFPYEGRPQTMRTFIVERGAVAPAPPAPAPGTVQPGAPQPGAAQPGAAQPAAQPRPAQPQPQLPARPPATR